MRILTLLAGVLAAATLQGAIDGVVVNGTTNKPQPGVAVTLVKPGEGGMKTLGSTITGADGKFIFTTDQPGRSATSAGEL